VRRDERQRVRRIDGRESIARPNARGHWRNDQALEVDLGAESVEVFSAERIASDPAQVPRAGRAKGQRPAGIARLDAVVLGIALQTGNGTERQNDVQIQQGELVHVGIEGPGANRRAAEAVWVEGSAGGPRSVSGDGARKLG